MERTAHSEGFLVRHGSVPVGRRSLMAFGRALLRLALRLLVACGGRHALRSGALQVQRQQPLQNRVVACQSRSSARIQQGYPSKQGECKVPSQGQLGPKIGRKSVVICGYNARRSDVASALPKQGFARF